LTSAANDPLRVVWVNADLHVGVGIYTAKAAMLEVVDHVARHSPPNTRSARSAFDPWRFGQARQELEREGLVCVQFQQNDARMIPASSSLHAAVVERRITLPERRCSRATPRTPSARHPQRGGGSTSPQRDQHRRDHRALHGVDRLENQPATVELLGWI
jgi:hypothetical protein